MTTLVSRPGPLLTTPDVIGLVVAGLGFGWSVIAVALVQPAFLKLFADFGSELPFFTALWMKRWVPTVGAVLPLVILGEGIARRVDERGRVTRMAIALGLSLLLPLAMLAALYLPIFQLAGAIK